MARLSISMTMLILLASSCTGDTLWHGYVHTPAEGWHANDTLSFSLPAARSEGLYPMDIELRTTPSFAYSSLSLVRLALLSHPADTLCDTICITTSADGHSLSGDGLTQQSFGLSAPPLHLQQGQEAHIRLYHIMLRGTMPDITDIGIRLHKGR